MTQQLKVILKNLKTSISIKFILKEGQNVVKMASVVQLRTAFLKIMSSYPSSLFGSGARGKDHQGQGYEVFLDALYPSPSWPQSLN